MGSPNIKILFLAANPLVNNYLEVYKEYNEVQGLIEREPFKEILNLILKPEIDTNNFISVLATERPQILHFAGHAQENGIIILGQNRKATLIDESLFLNILVNLQPYIQLVVLNACNTANQAEKIAEIVGCSIGITNEINDSTAVMFASKFYLMLALGYSIQKAFDLSIINLKLTNNQGGDYYKLYHRNGIDPNNIYLLQGINYKGSLFLQDPLIWNSILTIIDYLQNVHNFFLTLQFFYLNELIKKNDEIFKKSDSGRIESFRNFWDLYYREYNTNFQNKDKGIIDEVYNRIQRIEDEMIINTLKDIKIKFYQNIIKAINDYNDLHVRISGKIDQDFMRIIKEHEERTSIICDLTMKANGLIINTGELLKKIIELLH